MRNAWATTTTHESRRVLAAIGSEHLMYDLRPRIPPPTKKRKPVMGAFPGILGKEMAKR